MNAIPPVIRHLLICQEIRRSGQHPNAVDVVGLMGVLTSMAEPSFPFRAPRFGLFVLATNGRGQGNCTIRIRHADTGEIAHEAREIRKFAHSPLALRGLFFAIDDCVFPRSGLYMVQFRFEDALLAQEPLMVR